MMVPNWLTLLGAPTLLALLGSFVVGVVMIVGSLKMMRLKSYRWAMAASIAALLPCSPVGILGLAVGIWSLIVLNRRNVLAAFTAGPAASGGGWVVAQKGIRSGRLAPSGGGKSNANGALIIVVVLLAVICAPVLVGGFVAVVGALVIVPYRSVETRPVQNGPWESHGEAVTTPSYSSEPPALSRTPADDLDELGTRFVSQLVAGAFDEAFGSLSGAYFGKALVQTEVERAAWKESMLKKPEFMRLKELALAGLPADSGGQFDEQGRYLYYWRSGSLPGQPAGKHEIELSLRFVREDQGQFRQSNWPADQPDWKIDLLKLVQNKPPALEPSGEP